MKTIMCPLKVCICTVVQLFSSSIKTNDFYFAKNAQTMFLCEYTYDTVYKVILSRQNFVLIIFKLLIDSLGFDNIAVKNWIIVRFL